MSANNEMPKLSVVVPMYNEETNVEKTISRIAEVLQQIKNWELILVNDGSTDSTQQKAEAFRRSEGRILVVSYHTHRGRGRALREGFKVASGDIIVTIECDLSYHPRYILALYSELCQNSELDMVIGSVYMPGGKAINVPRGRLAISRLGNKILSFAFGAKLFTLTGMLRGYRRKSLEMLSLESDEKEIHLEIISKALSLNYLIGEIPVILQGRSSGKSKFKLMRTASSHVLLSLLEKPMIIFGIIGIILLIAGLACAIFLIVLWREALLNPDRPLIIVTAILLIGGLQAFFFGFLAIQQNNLRREIFRLQSKIKKNNFSNK